jgi:hypothetical protein
MRATKQWLLVAEQRMSAPAGRWVVSEVEQVMRRSWEAVLQRAQRLIRRRIAVFSCRRALREAKPFMVVGISGETL